MRPSLKLRARYKGRSILELIIVILAFLSEKIALILIKKNADVVFTPTVYTARSLEQRGLHPSKIKVIGNGIDLQYIKKFPSEPKEYAACLFGPSPLKGGFDAVKAWKLVTQMVDNSELVIIGYAEGWGNAMKTLLKKLGLEDKVLLTGYIDEPEKWKILKKSKVFLCSSYEEAWCIVIAEAAACGLPVVAYDDPILREVYENYIFFVPKGDIAELSKVLRRFLNNPSLAAEYATRSLKWANTHDWEQVAKREATVFSRILKND